jgi:tRNA modification GTPase
MLSQRDVAIVSPVPGTTRDVVSVALDLDGIKAVLSDTAGLRSTTDAVEQIGISRAAASVGEADLKVLVLPLPPFAYPWTDVRALLEEELVLPHVDGETIVLFNQVDLLPPSFAAASGDATPPDDAERARRLAEGVVREWMPAGPRWWVGSVETGEGMDAFLEHGLNAAVKRKYVCNRVARSPSDFPPPLPLTLVHSRPRALLDREGAEELPLVSSARQRYHLERALSHLLDFGRRSPYAQLHSHHAR